MQRSGNFGSDYQVIRGGEGATGVEEGHIVPIYKGEKKTDPLNYVTNKCCQQNLRG